MISNRTSWIGCRRSINSTGKAYRLQAKQDSLQDEQDRLQDKKDRLKDERIVFRTSL